MIRKVVVTGLGAVTPLGNDVPTFWNNLLQGICGIAPITRFDASEYKATLAAEVKDLDMSIYMEKSEIRKSDLFSQYAMAAACQAVSDSGIIGTISPDRLSVYFGSGIGGISTFASEMEKLLTKGAKRVSPYFIPDVYKRQV